ncbi:glycosyltransferase family 2 protein [Pseudarthrobacter phenanthrenivorans]|uniref:glycosyltransferase family 2 protein n=1 Tax=Pseudarthrobacter phenanthrenivorans TaxID=361575 RepID=UPI00112D9648|nr:glycosyltransferase family 2 protein [Pseudarthrobacter phenanthrenivorans]TPV49815.1 glycosyltransferase family 2 protein [Pseudarthrobacter phenanthrenivorans]
MENMAEHVSRRIRIRQLPKSTNPATVTVVISCYNYGRFLPQAVQSCLEQKGVGVDVIIVDDASTDTSLAVAKTLAKTNANVSVLAHSRNKGIVDTFNDGAKAATGEFLVRLDADDLLTPGSLARATLLAQEFPTVGFVYGHPLHFAADTLPKARTRASAWTIWPGLEWLTDRCRSGKNVITSPEVVMRRSVIDEVGYMAPLRHAHDMELWLRMAAFADVGYIHGADQAWHRDHPDSVSAREVDGLVDLRERLEAFDVLFAGVARSAPGAAALLVEARRTLVNEALRTARLELDRGLPHPELFDAYLRFAESIDSSVTAPAHLRSLRGSHVFHGSRLNPWRLARRIEGRARSVLSWHRWHREGVF